MKNYELFMEGRFKDFLAAAQSTKRTPVDNAIWSKNPIVVLSDNGRESTVPINHVLEKNKNKAIKILLKTGRYNIPGRRNVYITFYDVSRIIQQGIYDKYQKEPTGIYES